jgi:hypothetical protein
VRNRIKGIDEFSVARAFGMIAAAVALYGISLSAVALLDQPTEPGVTNPVWYAPKAPVEQRSEPTEPVTRGESFWTSTEHRIDAAPSNAIAQASKTPSFWHQRASGSAVKAAQLTELAAATARDPQ